MRNFLYRCPVTLFNVQGSIAAGDYEGQTFVTQSCPACGGFHLVDPLTGKSPERSRTPQAPPSDPSK
jgi:hypothetical protein